MAQIESIRVPGIDEALKLGDWVHSALRSAVNFSTGEITGDDILFNYQVGGTVSGGGAGTASKYHTNMPDTGKLPSPMEALIYFMSIVLPPSIGATTAQTGVGGTSAVGDANDIAENVTWELRIGASKKVYDDGNLDRFPGGGGIAGFSALYGQSAATDRTTVTNGVPGAGAKQPYAIPHSIGSLEVFDVQATVTTTLALAANTTVRVYLEGLIRRTIS